MVNVKVFHFSGLGFQSGVSESKISSVVSFLGLANLRLLYTNISILPQLRCLAACLGETRTQNAKVVKVRAGELCRSGHRFAFVFCFQCALYLTFPNI